MRKADINRWHFEIPVEDIRDETYNECKGNNPCFCCGKEIKEPKYFVHLLVKGNIISTDQPFDEREDQGFFPIGAECKNRVPNNFVFKLD